MVLAAFEALMAERAARGGGWQSTSGPAPLIVVNGPVRGELGFNAGGGVFGPGFRPNATVARSVGLIVRNVFGVKPQVLEQATQGLPGRWSICIAENEEESPWEPLSVEAGQPPGASAVSATLLRTCEFVDNRHTQDPEQVLWDFADTISRTGALIFRDTSCGVVFCPEHAQLLAAAGFSKAGVQDWLIEHCGRTGAELRRAGKDGVNENNVRFAADAAGPMKGDGEVGGSRASCRRASTYRSSWPGPGTRRSPWSSASSGSGRAPRSVSRRGRTGAPAETCWIQWRFPS